MLWVHQLRNQEGRGDVRNGDSKANKETSCNEHVEIEAGSLKRNAQNHENGAREDCHAPPEIVGQVRDNRLRNNSAKEEN